MSEGLMRLGSCPERGRGWGGPGPEVLMSRHQHQTASKDALVQTFQASSSGPGFSTARAASLSPHPTPASLPTHPHPLPTLTPSPTSPPHPITPSPTSPPSPSSPLHPLTTLTPSLTSSPPTLTPLLPPHVYTLSGIHVPDATCPQGEGRDQGSNGAC